MRYEFSIAGGGGGVAAVEDGPVSVGEADVAPADVGARGGGAAWRAGFVGVVDAWDVGWNKRAGMDGVL